MAAIGAYDQIPADEGFTPDGLWIETLGAFRASDTFKAFVRDMNMTAYWREHGFPSGCRAVGADDFECE